LAMRMTTQSRATPDKTHFRWILYLELATLFGCKTAHTRGPSGSDRTPTAVQSTEPSARGAADATEDRSRVTVAGPSASAITFERMSRWPEPGWQVPRMIALSPDGKWVTFLESEKQNDETALFAFDLESKEIRPLVRPDDLAKGGSPSAMSREEELRRERERK